MKIIFLDIDGVLNNAYTKERFRNFTGIDKKLVGMFLNWLEGKPYSIVLSSSWRTDAEFTEELTRNGITWISATPHIPFRKRGSEIEASLEVHKPERYVVLDDYAPSEFLKEQRPFLVQTSEVRGLEPKKLKRIDSLLGG